VSLFHIPTAFQILGLITLMMPIVVWFALASRHTHAIALWCCGGILLGIASLLIGLSDHIPAWATFTLANLLLFVGHIMLIQSLRLDLAVPWRISRITAASFLFMLVLEGIRQGMQDVLLCLQYVFMIWIVMTVYLSTLAWRIGHQEQNHSARWIAGAFLVVAVSHFYSLISMSMGLVPAMELDINPARIFFTLTAILAAVISNVAYVGLAFERSQRQTAEADNQYHAIIETTVDGFWVCDSEGRFVDVNRAYCEMVGYSRDELLAMRIADVEVNENPEDIQSHLQHIMQAGSDHFETRHRCKDGGLLQIEASINFLTSEGGKFMAFMRDIAERKKAEDALRASEELLREMSRVAKLGGWNLDLKTNKLTWTEETYRIHEVNPHFQPQVEEAINFYTADALPILKEAIERAVTQGVSYDLELPFITAKDNHLWVRTIGKTDKVDGQVVRLYGIFQDITERKATERQLRLTQFAVERFVDEVYIIRDDISFQYVNDTACRTLEYGREELMTMTVLDIDPFFNNMAEAVASWQAIKDAGSITLESLHRSRKGRVYPVEIHNNFIEYEGEEYVCSICHDITERKQAEEALKESEQRLQFVLQGSQLGYWDWNILTNEVKRNEQWAEMLGYHLNDVEFTVKQWIDFVHPEDRAMAWQSIQDHLEGRTLSHRLEYRMRMKDGKYKWILDNAEVVQRDANQRAIRMSGTHTDITERRTAEAKLMEVLTELQLFRTALDNVPSYIYTKDTQYRYTYANRPLLDFFYRTAETLVGCDDTHFFPPETVQRLRKIDSHVLLGEQAVNEIDIASAELGRRIYWEVKTPIYQPQSQSICGLLGISTDITELKNAEEEIKQLAFYDSLTQLPNRRLLLDRLQQALATSVRSRLYGALLFIDLDNFKTLNDTLGHDKGDLLLQEVASRISACVRECDTVARLGGDEFVVMLIGMVGDPEEATAQTQKIGRKILAILSQTYYLAGHEHYGSASIGITLFVGHSSPMDDLLKQADIALYQAKAAGRNALCFFDAQMQLSITARAALIHDLHYALAKKQFQLLYQMEVGHNHKIIGVEALLRWHHPERGLVLPQEFIPLAEETGLIQPIGQWVLESACALLKSWEKSPRLRHLHLAVNISARQFRQPDFVDAVLKILHEAGLDPRRLTLELTEGVALANVNDAIAKMTALKQVGVRFSLDDFGTGFSSLAYLARLPFDQLKIDGSFVQNIGVKPTDEVIIQAIVAMADELGIDVVPEGVETEAQRAFLEQHGCPVCQGYLFGKPVPLAEFEENLESAVGHRHQGLSPPTAFRQKPMKP
jgi:diguanylate cyclase (GGDEF)-like protein/PAS domain S-box-containing protein